MSLEFPSEDLTAEPPPATSAKPATDAELVSFEHIVGARGFYFAGLLLIALAAIYFFKLAFDQWIGPAGRVAIGLGAGSALMAGAAKFMPRSLRYAREGLFGLGAAVSYFSVYAAQQMFSLIAHGPAFAGFAGITAIVSGAAWKWRSERLAIAGAVAAFVTPFCINSVVNDTASTLAYAAFIDVALLALARAAGWKILPIVLLAGSVATVCSQYTLAPSISPDGWALIGIAFSSLFTVYFSFAEKTGHLGRAAMVAEMLNVVLVSGMVKSLYLGEASPLHVGLALLAVTMLHVGIGIYRKSTDALRLAFIPGITAFMSATGNSSAVASLAAATVAVSAYGARFYDKTVRVIAWGMQLLTIAFAICYAYTSAVPVTAFFFDERTLNIVATGIALLVLTAFEERHPKSEETNLALLRVLGHAILFFAFTTNVIDLNTVHQSGYLSELTNRGQVMLSALWSIFGCGYITAGLMRKRSYLRWAGLVVISTVLLKVLLIDLATLELPFRILSALVVGIIAVGVGTVYQKRAVKTSDGKTAQTAPKNAAAPGAPQTANIVWDSWSI